MHMGGHRNAHEGGGTKKTHNFDVQTDEHTERYSYRGVFFGVFLIADTYFYNIKVITNSGFS